MTSRRSSLQRLESFVEWYEQLTEAEKDEASATVSRLAAGEDLAVIAEENPAFAQALIRVTQKGARLLEAKIAHRRAEVPGGNLSRRRLKYLRPVEGTKDPE